MSLEHVDLAQRLGDLARSRGARIGTAESCTGGLIAAVCTSVPNSSEWFECAFVTYRPTAKTRLLGVEPETLSRFGAVSEETAKAMAGGALAHSDATHAVAVTGIAGPASDESGAAIGTLWIAWAVRDGDTIATRLLHASGDREAIRATAVEAALTGLIERLG